MVMCNMESVIPRPPALPSMLHGPVKPPPPPLPPPMRIAPDTSKLPRSYSVRSKASNHSQGFRLVDQGDQDETGSIYSIYKQKIDSMFESDSSTNTKNSVQAKIEKMFTDVAKDDNIPITRTGVHTFSVDYLGSVPLQEKVTSLAGLQSPLRELYFAYKKNVKYRETLTGRLEISSQGLKVQYQGDKGDLEQLNSFPTIAVWSAVKFVIHKNPQRSCAFLPLITDPDNIDKQSLFRSLDESEKKYIKRESHSPLFAVVMRKMGVHKQLECHGFVCQTSEDAIVIAATLYKSLMSHMKAKEKKPKNRNGITCMSVASSNYNDLANSSVPVRPPRKKRSTSSSVVSEADTQISDTQPLISSTKKPPKKSIKTRRAPKAPPYPPKPKDDLDAIIPYEEPVDSQQHNNRIDNNDNNSNKNDNSNSNNDNINYDYPEDPKRDYENDPNKIQQVKEIKPKSFSDKINTYMSKEQKQLTAEIKQVMSEGTNRGLKRVQSLRKREEDSVNKKENIGDILTKVTIPRSGSFLNTGGLTRYKSKISRKNGQASGGSPLGFSELFNEFRLQEGLHSMDEILGVIIDPEGMSFNDLKPIYKEFLLKLAVTLTKDELYQRSKMIMRKHKKKMMKKGGNLNMKRPNHTLIGKKFKRLKHIFQKSFRIKLDKHKNNSIKLGDIEKLNQEKSRLPESSISTSSYDTRHFVPKEPQPRRQNSRKKSMEYHNKTRRDRASTSEESDFLSVRKNSRSKPQTSVLNQNRNSSSGYVSCSECSYNSESCTCASADKCYCSLGEKSAPKKRHNNTRCDAFYKPEEKCHSSENTLTFCGCDTDSCAESNKCYCQTSEIKNRQMMRNIKQQTSYCQPEKATGSSRHKKACKRYPNTRSTRSVEYMHNPTEMYYEKLQAKARSTSSKGKSFFSGEKLRDNLEYEFFNMANGGIRNLDRSQYARAFIEADKFGMHRESSVRSYRSANYGSKNGKTMQSTSVSAGACTEAISVKKSAEIAALFADIKLSQTTDITQLSSQNCDLDRIRRHSYHNLPPHASYAKPKKCKNRDTKAVRSLTQSMVQNAIYSSDNKDRKNSMYSTRNGLYTIQSQSDDSRKSSFDNGRSNERDYFQSQIGRNLSNNLENSLGYLP